MTLSIKTREVGKITILDVKGKLVGVHAGRSLSNQVKGLVDAQRKMILLNLERVDDTDAHGVGCLVSIFTLVCLSATSLKILKPNKAVRKRVAESRIIGYPVLESFFEVFDSEQDALSSYSQASQV